MLLKMFTVYDSKTEAYMPPFYMRTTGEALRAFTETASDPKHTFNNHSEDYTLFCVGDFDDSNAKCNLLDTPFAVAKAIEVKGSNNV